MILKRKLLLLIAMICFAGSMQAQEVYEDGFLSHYGISLKVGTYGPGIDFHTSLSPKIKARVGFNYLPYHYTDKIAFDADNIIYDPNKPQNGKETLSGNITDAKLKFFNANLLADYYPSQHGIFCITGGFYIGNNKIDALGSVDDYTGGEFEAEDIVIKPDSDGSFSAKLRMGNVIKPYIGFGLGRTISKSPVSFRFDMGAVYQGKYTIESDNISSEDAVKANEKAADFDLSVPDWALNWWPMLSISLSYRFN